MQHFWRRVEEYIRRHPPEMNAENCWNLSSYHDSPRRLLSRKPNLENIKIFCTIISGILPVPVFIEKLNQAKQDVDQAIHIVLWKHYSFLCTFRNFWAVVYACASTPPVFPAEVYAGTGVPSRVRSWFMVSVRSPICSSELVQCETFRLFVLAY